VGAAGTLGLGPPYLEARFLNDQRWIGGIGSGSQRPGIEFAWVEGFRKVIRDPEVVEVRIPHDRTETQEGLVQRPLRFPDPLFLALNLQLGGEWEFAKNQELGFSAEVGLDGDGNGPDFGAMISYILIFGE